MMMKKLLLGIAVCCGVSGTNVENVNGMNDSKVSMLVCDLAHDPTDKGRLINLTNELVNREYGEDAVDFVLDEVYTQDIPPAYRKKWDQIVSMIWSISRDWCSGSASIRKVNSYVDGAMNGIFGPYNDIPNTDSSL